MQFPKCLFLAMTAGTALSATALAQQSDNLIANDRAIPVQPGTIVGGSYAPAGGYQQRVDLDVYDVGIPSESGGAWASSGVNVYDDVVVGGPYTSNSNPLVINGIALGFIIPANATPADDHLYTRLSFYPDHTPAATNPYAGTPVIWNLDWGAGWSGGAGFIQYYPGSVTFNGSVTLTNADVFNGGAGDKTLGLKKELFLDAAMTRYGNDWQIVRRANIPSPGASMNLIVGTSDFSGWFSALTGVTTGDILSTQVSGGTAANNRATYTALQGTGFVTAAPTPEFDFGNLADGVTNRTNITIPNSGVKWFSFTITNGAIDGLNTFLDIDGEGSAADMSIAVYDGNVANATYGSIASFDADTGSGTNPMLSFGMGRRAAVGDGRQYDGRNFFNGAAGLAAGTYYVAVAPAGSTFSNGFGVTPGPVGGTAQLHFNTNVNGAALAPSVAPAPLAGDDLTPVPLVAPGQQFAAVEMNAYEPRWLRFTTCRDASDAEPVTFDYTGTDAAGFSMTVFNGNGNFHYQFTTAANGLPPATVFNSSNPLPAGTYYVGLSYQGVQTQPNDPFNNGRWHLRGTQGNNGFAFGGFILVSNADCALACGTSDFNGDGDFGTDADIEAFFACLAGNCCDTCYAGGSDFNADGDFGTDADIESFFRVLAGGEC